MNELIKITDHNGKQAVSARELHTFLESKREFATWIKDRIKKYGLLENQDYVRFDEIVKTTGGRLIEYVLTIDCAKELAMVEGNAKGKQARKYFIECERQLKQAVQPLSELEILQKNITVLIEQEKKIKEHDSRILELEAKQQTRPDFFTIVGYGTLNGMSINMRQASTLGQRASRLCKQRNIETDTTPDARFGIVKMYPRKVLDEVFSQPIN